MNKLGWNNDLAASEQSERIECLLRPLWLGLAWSSSARLVEQVEEVELRGGLAQDSGLDSQGSVGPVKLDTRQLGSLNIPTQLCCGVQVTILVMSESESSLSPEPDTVSIAIIDPSGHEASYARLALPIQLQPSGEGRPYSSSTVSHLSSEA